MAKKSLFKRISPKVLVASLLVQGLLTVGAIHFFSKEKNQVQSSDVYSRSYQQLSSSKLKNLFTKVQKNPELKQEYLSQVGDLSQEELDQGYKVAVETYQYDLAIDFYNMGAKDCYKEGSDILLIAINSGRLDLVDDLLNPDYELKLYHLNAARSLVNIEQSNWAYIYKQQDTDDLGYQKYLIRAQKLASDVISIYKAQNPVNSMRYDTSPKYQQNYLAIHGENSQTAFEKDVQETLKREYKIIRAFHGTQRTPILVDQDGRKVGIIKTKNEILAHRLDYDHFAGVPPAISVNIPEKGQVIIQKWIPDSMMAIDYKRETEWNAEQLHHIRVLDIRLGNSDRNKGNVLICEKEGKNYIVPIDHDLIGHYIPNDTNWEAAYLNAPFSPLSKQYIEAIDIEKDACVMQELEFVQEDILSMKLRTTLLKMAIEHNLTLKETDMLFRFYYYDCFEKVRHLQADATEEQIREHLFTHVHEVAMTVQNPVEVWSLIGNNFELYL